MISRLFKQTMSLKCVLTRKELEGIITRDTYPPSKPRKEYLDRIKPWLERKEVIILKGVRRCGKTHLMYQLIRELDNAFYVNFDDYRLDAHLSTELLETILLLRNTAKQAYFFFDEIQRIKGFEKWLRTHYDKEQSIKFIIGGSNIALLSPEAATVLTGRNITFTIFPLSYTEWKNFCDEPFENYLVFGGFPEIALEQDTRRKRELLAQYVNDIIAKDLLTRVQIDNRRQLQALVQFLLAHPGVRLSANKLGKQIETSKDTAQKYLNAIQDTFLVFEVPHHSLSEKTKYIASRMPKYYAIDNGFLTVTAIKENKGVQAENAIAVHLYAQGKQPTYLNDKGEIDFIVDQTAIQVTTTDTIPARERKAFEQRKDLKPLLITPKGKEGISIEEFLKT